MLEFLCNRSHLFQECVRLSLDCEQSEGCGRVETTRQPLEPEHACCAHAQGSTVRDLSQLAELSLDVSNAVRE